MAIVSISRIQHRRGLQQDLPQLASAELGWALDSQKLFIGNGPILEGSPRVGNTEILTEHSDILQLAQSYTFLNEDAGYTPTTGGKNNKFTSIAYGNGIYVMVGTNGSLLTSSDSVNWTPVYGGTTNSLNSICFGYIGSTGYFIAVGASGTIVYSTDGAVWNHSTTTVQLTLTSVTWASALNIFVATSNSGSLIVSSDANVWRTIVAGGVGIYDSQLQAYTSGTTESLNSVAYYNGLIVAVGNAGTIITSTDGLTWTTQNSPTAYNLKTISWATTNSPTAGDGQWTAAGDYSIVVVSTDATNWYFGFTDTFRAAAHNTGIWVFVGDGGVIYKSLGTKLIATTSNTINNLYDIVYSTVDVQFVAVGANGTILTSQSGTLWTARTSGTLLDLNKVIHDEANNLYIAVGENGIILTSPDAVTWTIQTSNVADNLYGIAIYPNSMTHSYIAVGDNNAITRCSNLLGTSWSKVTTGFGYHLRSITVASLTGGSYKAVAVGLEGAILTSTNSGQNWTDATDTQNITMEDLNAVNYITWTSPSGITSSKFFIVGNNATVISSNTDGTVWSTPLDVPASNHMFNIYYGLDYFWVVGSVGYSTLYGTDITDPNTLTNQSLLLAFSSTNGYSGPSFNSSNYGINKFVLFGQYDSILVSDDGHNYVSHTTRNFVTNNLNAADIFGSLFLSNRFIAVGNKGLVLDSTDTITWNGRSYVYGSAKTTRSIQHKLDDFVSVKDFGAKGDGLTDDTESINRALYEIYCRTVNPAARKVLYFPAGRYIISDGINVPNNTVMRGEGMNNTIIQQTADPTYVSYVLTTADSKQQIGAQLGYNGAVLPADITIEEIGLESAADGIWKVNSSRLTLSRVRITGGLNLPNTDGNRVGIYIIGSTLIPPTDINITDCQIERFNYGVYQPGNEYSRNIIFNSTTFNNLYKGLYLCTDGGQVNTMTISNCVFDSIYDRAIDANYVTNITSTFNSYRDVGNSRGNSPVVEVIKFGSQSFGCASINDQFDRSESDSFIQPWVVGNSQTSAWFGGHNLRVGYYSQQGGETHTLLTGVTNQSVTFDGTITPLTYTINDSTYNQRIQYMIIRDSYTRSGVLQLAYNPTTKAYTIDDESSETGDVGVVFSLSSDNTKLTLKYTSTAGAATVFTLALAESFVKTSW